MLTDDWQGCYSSGWQDEIVSEAFCHPAKFSRALIRRIYEHCRAEGWVVPGDVVVDPFGGVALGALDAMRLGLSWVGIELEQKFVVLGNQNIALWTQRYGPHFSTWGTALLVQGDSRRLLDVIGEVGIVVSSPTYACSEIRGGSELSKIPLGDRWKNEHRSVSKSESGYGITPGNLGNLPATSAGFAAVVSSPPFLDQTKNDGRQCGGLEEHPQGGEIHNHYGDTPGQLGAMRVGAFDAVVSSPPFEGVGVGGSNNVVNSNTQCVTRNRPTHIGIGQNARDLSYGKSNGQLGASYGDDFWSAARAIVAQTFASLRPGGHAVWVVKDFVRKGKRIPFCDQWRQLCEACGFVTLHEHHAMLIIDNGTQLATDGKHKRNRKERKSFFRRLAEKKGSPAIDYEVVLCMEKTK